jgi:hypothetical protein
VTSDPKPVRCSLRCPLSGVFSQVFSLRCLVSALWLGRVALSDGSGPPNRLHCTACDNAGDARPVMPDP